MTTYYISPNGNDANNGLGPDASHASNKPYLTLGKAMATGAAVLPGDTIYIAPGMYYSSGNITPIAAIASVGSPTQFIGDPTNAQGFKDGSGVLLAPGIPWLTTRTSGEADTDIASGNHFFNANTNDPSGLQFKKLCLEVQISTNAASIWLFDANTGTDTLFEDCRLIGKRVLNYNSGAPTAGMNFTLRRCTIFTRDLIIYSTTTAAATADADLAILVEECFIVGSLDGVGSLALGASGGNIAGGIRVYDNTIICCGAQLLNSTALRVSTTTPIRIGGNLILCIQGPALSAGTSGQIIDDGYNRYWSGAANSNVTDGTGTVRGSMLNLVLPDIVKWGLEMPRADMFGWSDAMATAAKFSAFSRTIADYRGRTVRPWGAGASIGCWQAQDVTQDTSSAITGGGTNSLKLTGAGEVSLYIPVDAAGFTVSVRTKSTSYGGTNYPQMIVVANPSCGVTTDTTVTAAAATEETITTATITPTSKGVMEVRLISRSTSTTSTTHFDILTAA